MECARKYDIPELYFACRSWLLEQNKTHSLYKKSMCTSILIGALMLSDHGLAEACYSYNNGCCPLGQLDVEMLTNEGLCQILSKEDTLWSERELYELSLRWAKFHCGGNATPEQLREKLNAARFLIRYSKMTPAEISDGPAEAEIITPIETKLVFQQVFGSTKSDTYPFDDQARVPYRAWDGKDVTLPIVICDVSGFSDTLSVYQANARIHPEASAGIFMKFRQLRNLKYPFLLSVDGQNFDQHPCHVPCAEAEVLVAQLKLEKSTARYVMEGDMAFSYDEETATLRLHVAVVPGFKPAGWILVGSLKNEKDLKFLKAAGKMKRTGLCIVYYDGEEEGASSARRPLWKLVLKLGRSDTSSHSASCRKIKFPVLTLAKQANFCIRSMQEIHSKYEN
ncbi:hypothetical protein RvY_11319-1 [Ramazzottius varieornatus]|uniref:BACK domain-containing protein n=1 Tax=Ramazzottius varieornatus TaxID=947166 RepID=A0A1D1VI51_RAMVA|nr:hypothetical protein RvY_11319-1 [Ramazzottius varieornatus]